MDWISGQLSHHLHLRTGNQPCSLAACFFLALSTGVHMSEPRLDENELRQKLISGAKWAAALRFSAQMFSWVVNIVIVRFLLPDDYGLNAMLEVPIELLMLFSTLGLDLALVRKQQRSQEELSAAFGLLLVLNIVLFLGLVLGASTIAGYFKDPRLTLLIQVAATVFLLLPFRSIPNALLDRELAFKLKAQVDLASTVTASIVSLVMAVLGAGVWALVIAFVGSAALRVVLIAYLRPWLIMPRFSIVPIKGLIQAGLIMTASGALLVLTGRVVNLIAGPVLGAELLGYFAMSAGFAWMPLMKVMPIVQQVMYPAFARLEGQQAMATNYLEKTLEIAALAIFPMSLGLAFVAEDFVSTVFGTKWLPAAWPLAVLSMSTPFRLTSMVVTPALNGMGHADAVLRMNLVMLVVMLFGTPFAVLWKVEGLVVLSIMATLLIVGLSIAITGKRLAVPALLFLKSMGPGLLGSLVMIAGLGLLRFVVRIDEAVLRLAFEVISGMAIYVAAMFLLFRPRLRELFGR